MGLLSQGKGFADWLDNIVYQRWTEGMKGEGVGCLLHIRVSALRERKEKKGFSLTDSRRVAEGKGICADDLDNVADDKTIREHFTAPLANKPFCLYILFIICRSVPINSCLADGENEVLKSDRQ